MVFPDDRSREPDARRREHVGRHGRRVTVQEKLLMMIAIAAGSAGLVYFACHVDQVNKRVDREMHATATTVSHYKAVRIWLPQTLVEVAKRQATQASIQSHGELQRVLEREQLRELWYALTVREHHENGGFNDLTVIRRPYHDAHHFSEFPHVLAASRGNPRTIPRWTSRLCR